MYWGSKGGDDLPFAGRRTQGLLGERGKEEKMKSLKGEPTVFEARVDGCVGAGSAGFARRLRKENGLVFFFL